MYHSLAYGTVLFLRAGFGMERVSPCSPVAQCCHIRKHDHYMHAYEPDILYVLELSHV